MLITPLDFASIEYKYIVSSFIMNKQGKDEEREMIESMFCNCENEDELQEAIGDFMNSFDD